MGGLCRTRDDRLLEGDGWALPGLGAFAEDGFGTGLTARLGAALMRAGALLPLELPFGACCLPERELLDPLRFNLPPKMVSPAIDKDPMNRIRVNQTSTATNIGT
jgi:hypothetical protein